MKNKIKYMFETNKIGFIAGCIIFGILFIYFAFLTINAFSGGAIAGEKSEIYSLGECQYGKITYTGEVDENGMPSGTGKFSVSDGDKTIDIIGNSSGLHIDVETIEVTDYKNHYNTIISGDFDETLGNIANAEIRHEDVNGNYGLWIGNIKNGQLSEYGETYYMIPQNDVGYCRLGNYIDGKLTTIIYTEDIVISEIPPEESSNPQE